eukprot:Protomagalhaensia_sp_Gyna_25__6007@NODE_940_length_2378_cov_83_277041_g746_i0_p1_GENE_NODE_940_length_2378_cov_83_277041_g746_i0NODE_940_length_2378_cov_83_277041_g746_i0_p1_ORF_typecomplete_len426_score57_83WD40/PF00400_32/13WD40/PF00400_32/0_55Nup160/PF11715_8/3_8e02Nup160/PF11715_8/0_05tRNA_lig_kinase/PF08303_11/0_13_NODE_940_length_2378_cov_83_277041_g746_i01341411
MEEAVKRLYGDNIDKPNTPSVHLALLGNVASRAGGTLQTLVGVVCCVWGGTLTVADGGGVVLAQLRLSEAPLGWLEVAKTLNGWEIWTSDDDKQLFQVLLDGTSLSVQHSFLMRRRIMGAKRLHDGRLVLADKFGDIYLYSMEDLEAVDTSVRAFIRGHITRFPQDKRFFEMNSKYLPNPLESNDHIEPGDDGDSDAAALDNRCLACHLATVTCVELLRLPNTDGGQVELLVTCDRDEKIRVSEASAPFNISRIYCGHQSFVTDVLQLKGKLYSLGADKTLREWDLRRDTVQTACWELSEVPTRFVRPPQPALDKYDALLFLSAGSPVVQALVADVIAPHITLPSCPVEALSIDPHTVVWVDVEGYLHRHRDGVSTRCQRMSHSESPLVTRHWKHTQEDNVPSTEERLAKRLRHKESNHSISEPC